MKKINPTILIVDDDINDLALIQAAFKAANSTAKIQPLNGGQEAIAYLLGEGKYSDRTLYKYPDFIITDLKMPGVDGFALLRHLKNSAESAIIPTIIFSGSQDNDDIKKAYLLGACSYHVKPSDHIALRVLVKALLNYWMECEVPEEDATGNPLQTESEHKLGQRYSTRTHGPEHVAIN